MNDLGFTYNHYKNTIQLALDKNYTFLRCEQYNKITEYDKVVILRHDIDFSLKGALKLAKIENELGVTSSYFIRLHSRHYNPLEYNSYKIIKKIQNLGHEIGLHQEPAFAFNMSEYPNEYVQQEINSFNSIFQTKIKGVSTHEPTRTKIQITPENISEFNIEYESYFPVFTQNMKYISDSGARWREGDMFEWLEKNTPKLYVLTHPVWWYDKTTLENY